MEEKRVWDECDIKRVFKLTVDILNEHETRDKIVEKLHQRTGLRQNHNLNKSNYKTNEKNSMGIIKFGKFDNGLGDLIDNYLLESKIMALLPKVIKKAFSAYNTLKDRCIKRSDTKHNNGQINLTEYGFKLSLFTESIVYNMVNELIDTIKNNNTSCVNDISRWAAPYYLKDKKTVLTDNFYSDFCKYGISLFNSWIGENSSRNINQYIKRMDYHGLFIDNSINEKKFRFVTLENSEIKEGLMYYYDSIKQVPFEINGRLNRNLNTLPKSLCLISIEPSMTGFVIQNDIGCLIPGGQICIAYFPCEEITVVKCTNLETNELVKMNLSSDKLLFIDLNKNRCSFKNNSPKVTYCIITYIFGPT